MPGKLVIDRLISNLADRPASRNGGDYDEEQLRATEILITMPDRLQSLTGFDTRRTTLFTSFRYLTLVGRWAVYQTVIK